MEKIYFTKYEQSPFPNTMCFESFDFNNNGIRKYENFSQKFHILSFQGFSEDYRFLAFGCRDSELLLDIHDVNNPVSHRIPGTIANNNGLFTGDTFYCALIPPPIEGIFYLARIGCLDKSFEYITLRFSDPGEVQHQYPSVRLICSPDQTRLGIDIWYYSGRYQRLFYKMMFLNTEGMSIDYQIDNQGFMCDWMDNSTIISLFPGGIYNINEIISIDIRRNRRKTILGTDYKPIWMNLSPDKNKLFFLKKDQNAFMVKKGWGRPKCHLERNVQGYALYSTKWSLSSDYYIYHDYLPGIQGWAKQMGAMTKNGEAIGNCFPAGEFWGTNNWGAPYYHWGPDNINLE